MPQTPSESPYLSIAQVCAEYNVGRRAVTALLNSGQLRAYRFGPKLIRIKKADIEALLAESEY